MIKFEKDEHSPTTDKVTGTAPCVQRELPCYAKYSVAADGMILKDGHTMFNVDIAKDLNRKSFLEKEYKKLQERERHCPTMLESEARAILKALQEIAEAVGLDASNSPRETVEAVKLLVA